MRVPKPRRRRRPAPVSCWQAREAVSARLDGEEPGIPPGSLDGHLAVCESCLRFEADVVRLGRRLSLRSAITAPPLLARNLVALNSGGAVQPPHRFPPAVRVQPALTRAAQLCAAAVAALALVGASFGPGSHHHVVASHRPGRCTAGLHSAESRDG